MGVLLGLYYILFEREKMHRFNRFYLLSAVVFSLALPLVTIPLYVEAAASPQALPMEQYLEFREQQMPGENITTGNHEVTVTPTYEAPEAIYINYSPYIAWGLYLSVVLVLSVRFIVNILRFYKIRRNSLIVSYKGTNLVLLNQDVLPHTYLNNIYVSKNEYENKLIAPELFTHELTHVRQYHTLDILFIETLKTIFWFNPLLYFYKKAIQLNHEFLADEKVIDSTANTVYYQKLLLEKASVGTTFSMASNLTFSLTKKRFIMMTKTTSTTKAGFIKLVIVPVITALIMLLCTKTIAKATNIMQEIQSEKQETITKEDKRRDTYYAGVTIIVKKHNGELVLSKQYEELTLEQKREYLFFVPQGLAEKKLAENRFEDYKNRKKFAVWIDDKYVSDKILSNYTSNSFVSFTESFVHTNARSKKFPQEYQAHLYTRAYYDEVHKNPITHFSGKTYIYTLPDKKPTNKSSKKNTVIPNKSAEVDTPKSSTATLTENNTSLEKQERLSSHIQRAIFDIPSYKIRNMTVTKNVTQQQVDSIKIATPKVYVSNNPGDYGEMVIEYNDENGNTTTKKAFIEQ